MQQKFWIIFRTNKTYIRIKFQEEKVVPHSQHGFFFCTEMEIRPDIVYNKYYMM